MEINKHIGFIMNEQQELYTYLVNCGITHERIENHCFFDIYESNPHWEYISQFVQKGSVTCLSNTVYTKEELLNAKWLCMRSVWRCGYPQPENAPGYETVTYCEDAQCKTCGAGMRQTADFRIKKTPKWGRRHFMMLNWVGDEIFVDEIAEEILDQSDLSGFSFRTVKNKSGTQILPGIKQIVVEDILNPGIITDCRAIDRVYYCQDCKCVKYHPTEIGMLAFRREIFENAPDIIKTSEIFGWEYWTERRIVISGKMYKTLTQNKLDAGLEFSPIELL